MNIKTKEFLEQFKLSGILPPEIGKHQGGACPEDDGADGCDNCFEK